MNQRYLVWQMLEIDTLARMSDFSIIKKAYEENKWQVTEMRDKE